MVAQGTVRARGEEPRKGQTNELTLTTLVLSTPQQLSMLLFAIVHSCNGSKSGGYIS